MVRVQLHVEGSIHDTERGAHASAIYMSGARNDIFKTIASHDVVPSSPNERSHRTVNESIVNNVMPAKLVVKIHGRNNQTLGDIQIDILKEIVADDVTAFGPWSATVPGAAVVAILTNPLYCVELEDIIITETDYGCMRRKADIVIREILSHATEYDTTGVSSWEEAEICNGVAVNDVVRWLESVVISSVHGDATAPQVFDRRASKGGICSIQVNSVAVRVR